MSGVDLDALGALVGVDEAIADAPCWNDSKPAPKLDKAARYGFVGEILESVETQTEADPAAILATFLAAYGNAIGPHSRALVGSDEHPGRISVAIVASTASGKGQSLGAVRPILRAADDEWYSRAYCSGFASGEAVIARLSGRHAADGEFVEKRSLIVEPEFARLLSVNGRDGSTLSPIIRGAWDDGRLQMIRAKETILADGAHLTLIGHITPDELRQKLSSTEIASGFANRILFVHAQRARRLPTGGHVAPETISGFGTRLRAAMEHGRNARVLRRTMRAEKLWEEFYLAEPDRAGIVGAVTARAHAQKLRLSVLYALLDLRTEIDSEHVLAAEAVWRYCAASAEHIFGGLLGNDAQDRILDAAREAYPNALDGTDVRDLFARKKSEAELVAARIALEERQLIAVERDSSTGGRPRSLIYALPSDQSDQRRRKHDDELFGRLMSLWSPSANGRGEVL